MFFMKIIPSWIQDFRGIIESNYLYVDKTQQIYNLVSVWSNYFFQRPRRFWKSLLISTLRELFLWNEYLFNGLSIMNTDFVFKKHPVITLDFSAYNNQYDDINSYILNKTVIHLNNIYFWRW